MSVFRIFYTFRLLIYFYFNFFFSFFVSHKLDKQWLRIKMAMLVKVRLNGMFDALFFIVEENSYDISCELLFVRAKFCIYDFFFCGCA